jgi:hypothetical protein
MVKHVNLNHAMRAFDPQGLQDRHPDRSEPFPKHVVPTEIAVAYGGRRVRKLVDVLRLPAIAGTGSETLSPGERARCMRYLLGLMTDQEAKAEAVACEVAAPLAATLTGENESAENKTLACELLASLAHSLEGRGSIVAIDALVAAAALLKDDDTRVRVSAGEFLASMAKHADGAAAALRAAEGNVLVLLATAAVEDSPPASAAAKTLCCETLALLTLTDEGTTRALEAKTVFSMMTVLTSESARSVPDGAPLKAAAARCLKNVCQHGVRKIAAFETGALDALVPLLRSRDTDVRLQATGALLCLTVEIEAKKALARTNALFDLCALLRDGHAAVAENALRVVQQCAEAPDARKRIRDALSNRDKALVFDERVVGNCVVSF